MIVLEHAVNSFGVFKADLASRLDSWRLTFARKPDLLVPWRAVVAEFEKEQSTPLLHALAHVGS